jgi:hypothetical protein
LVKTGRMVSKYLHEWTFVFVILKKGFVLIFK